eukprot:417484-Alexandrium_andersonii.AAC.1
MCIRDRGPPVYIGARLCQGKRARAGSRMVGEDEGVQHEAWYPSVCDAEAARPHDACVIQLALCHIVNRRIV